MVKAATKQAEAKATKAPKKGAAAAPAPADSSGSDLVYLEFQDGASNKFYEIKIVGLAVHSRYGRIGDSGAVQLKEFGTSVEARAFLEKTVKEKTKKGYGLAASASAAARAAPIPPRAPSSPGAAAAKKAATAAPVAAAAAAARGGTVYLEFREGSSSKFYEMVTVGLKVNQRWGRIGDGGTSAFKDFGSAAEAQAFVDKTVKEKAKKGYGVATAGSAGERHVPLGSAPSSPAGKK